MALPGISNANEFYSANYRESVLAGDIKKVPQAGAINHAKPWPLLVIKGEK
jgi:hypothetical protein